MSYFYKGLVSGGKTLIWTMLFGVWSNFCQKNETCQEGLLSSKSNQTQNFPFFDKILLNNKEHIQVNILSPGNKPLAAQISTKGGHCHNSVTNYGKQVLAVAAPGVKSLRQASFGSSNSSGRRGALSINSLWRWRHLA